ncbi:antitermination protein, partial [Salmonella enterica subsp. enterica]|nr:antitermination protein [Salmonella enterica subsp. enterica serovar Napoli]EAC0525675.1 antitermination protein [Salmonella enterica subsp. enterica serovar Zaiman]EAU6666662.1 antitermination protein [Salmonella enterica]EDS5516237.1 antitermination protein [Salmonella enterica subsp. enterica]EDW4664951.1 antitermination protein [Salmonella enterica subsp. enterica serovar Bonn]
LKFSNVLEGVRTEWDVKKTTAYDHIQPLFELLVEECHRQEGYADSALKSVTQ